MLCDEWIETALQSPTVRASATEDELPQLVRFMGAAQRFALAPDAVRAVSALAASPPLPAIRAAAFAPAEITWLEWTDLKSGAPMGALLRAQFEDGVARAGMGIVVTRATFPSGRRYPLAIECAWSLPGPAPLLTALDLGDGEAEALLQKHAPQAGARLRDPLLGAFILAALSMIATPRLTLARPADLDRLNRARRRRGTRPLLGYSEIRLAPGAPASTTPATGAAGPPASGRALHHVRAHYRLVPGGVSLVRQHLRGDPLFGIIRQRHVVEAPHTAPKR